MSDRGDMLAANVRSFLSSAPYCAPENWSFLIDQKLAKPLAEYTEADAPWPPTDHRLLLFEDGLADPVACIDLEGRLCDEGEPRDTAGLPKILFADVPIMLHLSSGITLAPLNDASAGTAGR